MPRFDGTGPQGKGPMTGRGLGLCAPKEAKEESPVPVRMGRGQGRLRRVFERNRRGGRRLS